MKDFLTLLAAMLLMPLAALRAAPARPKPNIIKSYTPVENWPQLGQRLAIFSLALAGSVL